MSQELGYVVIAGRKFPVESLTLIKSGVRLTFTIPGPQDPFTGHLTVFGADGTGCWQGHAWSIPELAPGVRWACQYDVRITEIYSYDKLVAFGPGGEKHEQP